MRILVLIASAGLLISCGVVGSPIAPEYVGVAVTVEKQKRQHARETDREGTGSVVADPSLEDPDLNLPPSYPVGTR
ncbi:MAG: hypothetical protein OEV99_14890 [Nitrospira sp.]|nr:hypothetical protein [Nitrospira sp.]MDH4371107.1 hypothetical protein [Nitrospira sp.]MDH5348254.1 hypothetical protein [Nitrospira sp.]MDH5499370.1 hypothetical protein [Nitrospira sp.]MDH5726358.1 hypothetical protein [Nitrospira sp.]